MTQLRTKAIRVHDGDDVVYEAHALRFNFHEAFDDAIWGALERSEMYGDHDIWVSVDGEHMGSYRNGVLATELWFDEWDEWND